MSLLAMLKEAQGGQGLGQLAERIGIDQSQAEELTGMLAPTIGRAAKRRAEQGGLEQILGQFMGERQAGYIDEPARAAEPEARAEGEQFLEQLFGSREATQQFAGEASRRSGVDSGIVEQFLPAIAAMVQGGMQRRMPDNDLQGMLAGALGGGSQSGGGGGLLGMVMGMIGGGRGRSAGAQQGGGLDPLMRMLDADGDGSVLDDVLETVMRR